MVRYWHTAIDPAQTPGANTPYSVIIDPTEGDATGSTGWKRADTLTKQDLLIAWDEGVHSGLEHVKGCGCGKSRCKTGVCSCRKAGRQCGAYCKCQSPAGSICQGLGCACDDGDGVIVAGDGAAAAGAPPGNRHVNVPPATVVVPTDLDEDDEHWYVRLDSDDSEDSEDEDEERLETREDLREDGAGYLSGSEEEGDVDGPDDEGERMGTAAEDTTDSAQESEGDGERENEDEAEGVDASEGEQSEGEQGGEDVHPLFADGEP